MRLCAKQLIAAALTLAALLPFGSCADRVLTPKRHSFGCLWQAYLQEPEHTVDVMYFGSSITYCDILPAAVYEDTGVISYVMAGPVQTMAETYYYVLETGKTQSPKVIFVEASALFYTRMREYDLVNIGYMPFGVNKWRAMISGVPAAEWGSYLSPLYAYHGRYEELTERDIREAVEKPEPDILAGYTYLTEAKPFETVEPKEEPCTAEEYETSASYLRKIGDYCDARDIRLVVYLSPRRNFLSAESMEKLRALSAELGAEFVDFNESAEAMGIDPLTDYYDRSHLNFYGAEKFTAYLSVYLTETLELAAAAETGGALWDRRVEYLKFLRER